MEAAQRAALIFRMARHAAQGQEIISYLVSNALDTAALRVLGKALQSAPGNPRVVVVVQRVLQNEWKQESYARAFRGEVVMTKVILDNLKIYGPQYDAAASTSQVSAMDELESVVAKHDPEWTASWTKMAFTSFVDCTHFTSVQTYPTRKHH